MLRIAGIALAAAALAAAATATVTGELAFDRSQLMLAEQDGMTVVSLGRLVSTWQTGAPSVPVAVARFVVPPDMKATGVRIDAVETETVPGRFDIYPVQPPRSLSDPGPFDYAPPDPKHYAAPFPDRIAAPGYQGSMSGYSIASVFVAPLQYDGTRRLLLFHPRVRFTLELVPADLGYVRPRNRSPEARRLIEARVAAIVLNPQDVTAFAPR